MPFFVELSRDLPFECLEKAPPINSSEVSLYKLCRIPLMLVPCHSPSCELATIFCVIKARILGDCSSTMTLNNYCSHTVIQSLVSCHHHRPFSSSSLSYHDVSRSSPEKARNAAAEGKPEDLIGRSILHTNINWTWIANIVYYFFQFVRIYTSSVFLIVKKACCKREFDIKFVLNCSASRMLFHVTLELKLLFLFWIQTSIRLCKKKKN